MFIKYLRDNQRGVLFRLGKLTKVVGPGLVVTIPAVDNVRIVEIDKVIPGWRGYSKQELDQRVISLIITPQE